MGKAASYLSPSKRPLWVNAVFIIIYSCAAWTVVEQVEKWRNPANFPLEVLQQIQQNQELTKENLLRAGRITDEQAAAN